MKELEEALLDDRIDVAVHSAKDMTSSDTTGLAVGAYTRREDPRDALCGSTSLRAGMRIGTASARRRAQLLALEPTLSIEPLRGNIDTRLRKRGERGLDAVVLAACGPRPPGSVARSGTASTPSRSARGRAGSDRAAGPHRRGGARGGGGRRGHASPWRRSVAAWRCSVAAASRRSPRITTACG